MNTDKKVGVIKNIAKLLLVPDQVSRINQKLDTLRSCNACTELRASCQDKLDTVIKLLQDR